MGRRMSQGPRTASRASVTANDTPLPSWRRRSIVARKAAASSRRLPAATSPKRTLSSSRPKAAIAGLSSGRHARSVTTPSVSGGSGWRSGGPAGTAPALASAADRAHRARRLHEPRLVDAVLELLAPDGLADDPLDLVVARAVAQRRAQVGLVDREQAGAQAAVGGKADAVAVAAERVADRVDEADLALAVGEAVRARGRVRLARLGLERVDGADRRADLLATEHAVGRPAVVGVERHELDEAHLVRVLARELGERDRLLLGEPAHRDRVDLDRVRLGVLREDLEAAQNARQRVAAGPLEEAGALERVDRDVEAVDARAHELLGVALEQVAVRRDREVLDARHAGEHRGERREVAADEWLAAGQAHVADAHVGEQRDEPDDLLEAQDVVALEPRQPLRRHAVLAAEVAAVGDGDADVGDPAPVAVDQRLAGHGFKRSGARASPGRGGARGPRAA